MSTTVATFYKFVSISDPQKLRDDVSALCDRHGIRGTLLIAGEGINATVSGDDADVAALLTWLRADARFADLVAKQSLTTSHPFKRLKVKVKPEIVSFGHEDGDPLKGTGRYVAAEDWNALIAQPDVVVIDTRNSYEFDVGTFEGAVDPETRSFREFPAFVEKTLDPARHKKIAMFCTGGIRCEKATAYMLAQGFEEVFHLEGGILKYLEVIPPEESLWRGECFIFDERVALEHGVTQGHYTLCRVCGYPVVRADEVTQDGSAQNGAVQNCCHKCRAAASRETADDTHFGC